MEPWRCLDCGAVLGQMQVDDDGRVYLLLYREAVQLKDEMPSEVDVAGYINHSVNRWKCSSCGKTRSWQRRSEGRFVKREAQTYKAE